VTVIVAVAPAARCSNAQDTLLPAVAVQSPSRSAAAPLTSRAVSTRSVTTRLSASLAPLFVMAMVKV
jgi:hypothetical protein